MIRLVLSHTGMAAGLGLLLSAARGSEPPLAQAQTDVVLPETVLRIATAGEPRSLRAGPSADQPIVTWVYPDDVVTLAGTPLTVNGVRWMPVRTTTNVVGWISDEYVVANTPPPAPLPVPEPVLAESPPLPPAPRPVLDEAPPPPPPTPVPSMAVVAVPAVEAPPQSGGPLEVEVKVKYPEAKGRHQEVTIWVTRGGVPVPDVTVTIFTEDDKDEPLRVLEPTNAEGRTRREISIGKEKGSIDLFVSAVAPDGGAGRATVSYFRR